MNINQRLNASTPQLLSASQKTAIEQFLVDGIYTPAMAPIKILRVIGGKEQVTRLGAMPYANKEVFTDPESIGLIKQLLESTLNPYKPVAHVVLKGGRMKPNNTAAVPDDNIALEENTSTQPEEALNTTLQNTNERLKKEIETPLRQNARLRNSLQLANEDYNKSFEKQMKKIDELEKKFARKIVMPEDIRIGLYAGILYPEETSELLKKAPGLLPILDTINQEIVIPATVLPNSLRKDDIRIQTLWPRAYINYMDILEQVSEAVRTGTEITIDCYDRIQKMRSEIHYRNQCYYLALKELFKK